MSKISDGWKGSRIPSAWPPEAIAWGGPRGKLAT